MTRAARILAAVMGLCVLVVAPAASPEKTGGSTRGPSLLDQVKGTGDETKRMYVTQDVMSAFARSAAHAAALEEADEAIEELQRLANSLLKNPDFADEIRRGLAVLRSPKKGPSGSRIPTSAPARKPL